MFGGEAAERRLFLIPQIFRDSRSPATLVHYTVGKMDDIEVCIPYPL